MRGEFRHDVPLKEKEFNADVEFQSPRGEGVVQTYDYYYQWYAVRKGFNHLAVRG